MTQDVKDQLKRALGIGKAMKEARERGETDADGNLIKRDRFADSQGLLLPSGPLQSSVDGEGAPYVRQIAELEKLRKRHWGL
ncbi:MAG TPA: hypothetical protein VI756_14965 [Blastocatellia bacterium]